jgi:hypothetical protein
VRWTLICLGFGLVLLLDPAVWEADCTSLRQLLFGFQTKVFKWEDIIRVGLEDYTRPGSSALRIEYVPSGATKTCWLPLRIDPAERERFIAVLREFARKADFDVHSKL